MPERAYAYGEDCWYIREREGVKVAGKGGEESGEDEESARVRNMSAGDDKRVIDSLAFRAGALNLARMLVSRAHRLSRVNRGDFP